MKRVEKPWGWELWWAVTDRYVGKVIHVRAGEALSLQYHQRKKESMLFWEGEGVLTLGDAERRVRPMEAVTIEPGTVHRIRAITDLTFMEVSTPEVDDVVRLADDYGRAASSPTETS